MSGSSRPKESSREVPNTVVLRLGTEIETRPKGNNDVFGGKTHLSVSLCGLWGRSDRGPPRLTSNPEASQRVLVPKCVRGHPLGIGDSGAPVKVVEPYISYGRPGTSPSRTPLRPLGHFLNASGTLLGYL